MATYVYTCPECGRSREVHERNFREWCAEHLDENAPRFGGKARGRVVEMRRDYQAERVQFGKGTRITSRRH